MRLGTVDGMYMDLWYSLKKLFKFDRADAQLNDEVLFHLEMSTEQKVAGGMEREQAYKEALREFGGVEQIKESTRESWGMSWLQSCHKDFQFGWRQLLKNKKQSVVIVLTLAVCIGANTTAYNLVHKLVTRPYAYQDAKRIVRIGMTWPKIGYEATYNISPPFYDYIQKEASSYENTGMLLPSIDVDLDTEGGKRRITIDDVQPGVWELVGAKPLVGRFFTESDAPDSVVVGESLWNELRKTKDNLLGEQIVLDGRPRTVIGVAPKELYFGTTRADAFTFCDFPEKGLDLKYRSNHGALVLGTLKHGVSVRQASEELDQIHADLLEQYPEDKAETERSGAAIVARPVNRSYAQHIGLVAPAFKTIQLITLLVLLIGCLNISGMILMKNYARLQEFAMRRALGASKRRLIRQIFIEISLYFLCGGVGSFLFWKAGHFIADRLPQEVVPGAGIWDMDFDAGIITLLTIGLATMLTAATPILYMLRVDLSASIKATARTLAGSLNTQRVHAALVILQVALSMVVLVFVCVLVQNLRATLARDTGFEKAGRIAITLPQPIYRFERTREAYEHKVLPLQDKVLDSMRAMPGVLSATACNRIPVSQKNRAYRYYFLPDEDGVEQKLKAMNIVVRPGYFETMGIQLQKGRDFNQTDTPDTHKVVIISENIAKQQFEGVDPVGKIVRIGKNQTLIIGVAPEVQHTPFYSDWNKGTIYRPFSQCRFRPRTTYIAHVEGAPSAYTDQLQAMVSAIDPQATFSTTTLEKEYDSAIFAHRLPVQIALFSASVALLITVLGLYGLIGCSIAQRTREYSIRMALGAMAQNILKRVIKQYGYLILWGQLLGLLFAVMLAWKTNALMPEINTLAPLNFIVVSAVLFAVYAFACLLPVRRVIKLNPMEYLRAE